MYRKNEISRLYEGKAALIIGKSGQEWLGVIHFEKGGLWSILTNDNLAIFPLDSDAIRLF